MTNSNRKIHHKNKHTVLRSNTTTRRTVHCSGLLPWVRERRARRCRSADDATRRRPTSQLADPRSGERPLGWPTRPSTVGSVGGHDTARRTHLSSPADQRPKPHSVGSFALSCRPRRPANNKFAQLTHSQHAVSVRLLYSTANFHQFVLPTTTNVRLARYLNIQ